MLACVRDRVAQSARWSTMFRGPDQMMCSYNLTMDVSLSAVDEDANTLSKRTASILLRFIAQKQLTRFG
jgi:hypothetical protein